MLAATLAAGLLTSCSTSGLSFREDTRVRILAPADRAEVSLPVTVRWEVRDFEVTGPTPAPGRDAGYFGVFVDQAPPPAGKTLRSLVAGDRECQAPGSCAGAAYLASRGMHTTTDDSFTVTQLPELRRDGRRELHEVVVVLLDGRGRRIGEGAFSAEFFVDRSR